MKNTTKTFFPSNRRLLPSYIGQLAPNLSAFLHNTFSPVTTSNLSYTDGLIWCVAPGCRMA